MICLLIFLIREIIYQSMQIDKAGQSKYNDLAFEPRLNNRTYISMEKSPSLVEGARLEIV